MMLDYYQVLGVKSTASVKEIKAAYKKLARLRHPDLNGGSAEAAQAFVQLSYARDILVDPKRRAAYDAERNARAGPGSYAPVLKPAGVDPLQRARSDGRIRQNLENFLSTERKQERALRQAVFPIVAFLFAAFCVALIRPRIWRYSGWTGRAVILTLVSLGVAHTVAKIWNAIKMLPADQTEAGIINLPLFGKSLSRRPALLLIGLAAIVCGLMGTLVGLSLSDVLSMAMPRFFDQSIRLDLLLYPWVMVLFLNACHSLSQRLDI
jgi:DnaJ-like protein